VILLTDDAGSRREAVVESKGIYRAKSVRSYVQQLEAHNPKLALSDLVANYGTSTHLQSDSIKEYFPKHLESVDLTRGVQSGTYHRGVFGSTADGMGRVTIRNEDDRVGVTIVEWADRNRAVDGDVVAIALNPLDQWLSSTAVTSKLPKVEDSVVGIASDTAEPTQSEMTNVPDFLNINDMDSLRPTGKVVGIIRRNFSTFCGSIYSAGAVHASREAIAKECQRENADGSTTCVFFAVDKNIPPILIRTSQRERLTGMRIEVAMDSWPSTSPYPPRSLRSNTGKSWLERRRN
jgi:exosome complex exonuclease DIS3/RRP44